MTLTVELPDDLAQILLKLPQTERNRRITEALRHETTNEPLSDELQEDFQVMDYYGIGVGRPGAVGDDVEGYIKALRSDWDERDTRFGQTVP